MRSRRNLNHSSRIHFLVSLVFSDMRRLYLWVVPCVLRCCHLFLVLCLSSPVFGDHAHARLVQLADCTKSSLIYNDRACQVRLLDGNKSSLYDRWIDSDCSDWRKHESRHLASGSCCIRCPHTPFKFCSNAAGLTMLTIIVSPFCDSFKTKILIFCKAEIPSTYLLLWTCIVYIVPLNATQHCTIIILASLFIKQHPCHHTDELKNTLR